LRIGCAPLAPAIHAGFPRVCARTVPGIRNSWAVLLGLNPFMYLRDVIERVSTHMAPLVLQLTPRESKRLRQDSAAEAAA